MNNVTISEEDGVRSLHFGTKWVQGAMRLERPDAIELEYVQQMMMWTLFLGNPRAIAQLGLGAGTLTKFCHRHFPEAAILAVELDPAVTAICRSQFALPPDDDRLRVVHMDAMAFVLDEKNHGAFDVLQVDLYDAQAKGPVLDTAEFYEACARCLSPKGIMTVNLFCDYPDHDRNLQAMEPYFEAVAWLPEVHDGNIVAIGFKEAPSVDFSRLEQRAAQIERGFSLPAASWVDGLQAWMQGG
ncbi:MAG TPA: fused MFS/spermidine synthase [Candidimonas sp.]|nr:fused MFS/spermidine synthase [Candidimonas sp.]